MKLASKMRTNFFRRLIVPVLALTLTLMGGLVTPASAQIPRESVRIEVRGDYAYVYHTYTYSDGRSVTIVEVIPIRSIPSSSTST
jgi:hypothetical protein